MKLCDVNVLVYAHREDSEDHDQYADWLINLAVGPEAYGLSEAVLAGFVRVVTNRRIYKDPTPIDRAMGFCEMLLNQPQACLLRPGPRNWPIFKKLCLEVPATGKLVSDAWHAALAIEYDCTWISTDTDFARFRQLKRRHPLA